jgi:hypothetical protein
MMSWCVCHGGCISKFSDIACTRGRSTYSVSSPQTTLSLTSRKTTDGFSRWVLCDWTAWGRGWLSTDGFYFSARQSFFYYVP